MSEKINKVLASTAQAFSTAEQKQARDNINAQQTITYSYSGSTITAIDGSAVGSQGGMEGIYHDSSLSGSGTSGSPLGLSVIPLVTVNHDSNISGSGTSGSPLGLASTINLTDSMPYSAAYGTYSVEFTDPSSRSVYGVGNMSISASSHVYWSADESGFESHAGDFTNTIQASSIHIDEHNGGDADALLTNNSLTFTERYKPTAQLSNDKLFFRSELGALTFAEAEYTPYQVSWTYPLPGDDYMVASAGVGGMQCYADLNNYSAKYGGAGLEMSSKSASSRIRISVDTASNYFGILLSDSANTGKILPSSINAWNNCISSVSAGVGINGDGVNTPLSVTGLSYDYTSIYQTSRTHISSNIDMVMDDNRHTTFTPYGMRIEETGTAPNHSSLAEYSVDHVNLHDYDVSAQAILTPTGLQLSDSANTVTIAASAWSSLTAWATAQGWNP